VNYTYAKSIDNSSSMNSAGQTIQDPRNLAAERGRSTFDIGHALTINFSYLVPWRYHQLGWLRRGWQLAGSGRASTGPPFTPITSGYNLSLGDAIRPDRLNTGTVLQPTPERWFDRSAFSVVPSGSYRFGTSGRDILDGPGFVGMNVSLSKNMNIRERGRVQLRWEAFNMFNHANFNLPDATVNTLTGGTITKVGAARTVQFGLRYQF
jgi:hypothetical protein